jgi:hypothetical protein
MADTKTKTTDADQLPVDDAAEQETTPLEATTELGGYAGYDVPDFEKRRAALELAITANSPSPVLTAGEFYAFLSTRPTPEVIA